MWTELNWSELKVQFIPITGSWGPETPKPEGDIPEILIPEPDPNMQSRPRSDPVFCSQNTSLENDNNFLNSLEYKIKMYQIFSLHHASSLFTSGKKLKVIREDGFIWNVILLQIWGQNWKVTSLFFYGQSVITLLNLVFILIISIIFCLDKKMYVFKLIIQNI